MKSIDRVRRSLATPATLALLTTLAAASHAAAQKLPDPPDDTVRSRFSASIGALNLQPLGSLATGPGWGVDLSAALAVDPAHLFRIRGDLRVASYGRDTRTVCLSQTIGCLIQVDVNTDYTSFYFGVGPELAFRIGGPTLVLSATGGVGGFNVSSGVEGTDDPDNEDLFRTENFSETHVAYSAGGQLRIPVSRQVLISLGAYYHHNGEATYVPPGGVSLNPDNTVAIDELTTDANQVAFTLGIAFHPFQGWTEGLEDEDGR